MSKLGQFLVDALPVVIKSLGVIGTIALIMVAGEIFAHRIDYLHHVLPNLNATLKQVIFGLVGGLIGVALFTLGKKIYSLVAKK